MGEVGTFTADANDRQHCRDCTRRGTRLNLPSVTPRTHDLRVRQGETLLRVTAIAEDIVRVRLAPGGTLPEDASWAVLPEMRHRELKVRSLADEYSVGFRTEVLAVQVNRETLALTVADLAGRTILADHPEVPFEVEAEAFALRKTMPATEHYFGLGDGIGPLDRRGYAFETWNTDAFGFGESTDPAYKSVPFFVAAGGEAGSYGLLLDNSWRGWFDFGRRDPSTLAVGSSGGPIDYYVIYGPAMKRVVERYTDLTGKAPLPPLWALGFQQSRYSYMSADEVRDVADGLRRERIPADVIWLDIDYQDRDRPFTTDKVAFPDLAGLVADVGRQAIRLVAITDAHIPYAPGEGYAPFDAGAAGDHFVKTADGSVFVGPVWPGPCAFPDFTRAATRVWWGGLYEDFVAAGVAGFWNDMNEPAVFDTPTRTMPLDVSHRIEEEGFLARNAGHMEIHNIYGMQNSRATYEGLARLAPAVRPFVMTRASFAGGHRYAVTWTGDNSATWSHLKLSVSMLLNLGLSGFSYAGADIGGFDGHPSPELMTRWIQIAAFIPIMRVHSNKGTPRREPWLDGPAHTAIRRRFIEERYRLLPYIYALADANARTGAPLIRPVFYEFPEALSSPCDQSMTFLLGDRLLVAPPPRPESPAPYAVCLPAGQWFDYWTGAPVTPGSSPHNEPHQVVEETPRLDHLPVYVRAGAILPRQPLVQSTSKTPQGPLSLDIYLGGDCKGVLYTDDGICVDHPTHRYFRQLVSCCETPAGLAIEFHEPEGDFRPWWREIEVTIHGWSGLAQVSLGDQGIVHTKAPRGMVRFTLTGASKAMRVTLTRPVP